MSPFLPAFAQVQRLLAVALCSLLTMAAGAQAATPQVPLDIIEEQILAQEETGESGGEPSAEDAPVEGEPGPGDAVEVPPDEPASDEAPQESGQEKPEN